MDTKELLKITTWAKVHNDNLKALYEQFKADTDDIETTFVEFCFGMYHECKH
jgi:hypothetical protein